MGQRAIFSRWRFYNLTWNNCAPAESTFYYLGTKEKRKRIHRYKPAFVTA